MEKLIGIEDLKRIQLDILDNVHQFCMNNNIRYYLTYGSLIGAIRHKGYIPWDDDIDICMPRPDYEKFMESYDDETNRLKFVCHELDKKFPYTFGKVFNTETTLMEQATIKYPIGINIDVFPIDGIMEGSKILKHQVFLRNLLNIKTIKYSNQRSFYKNIIIYFLKTLLIWMPINYLVDKMIKNSKKYSYQDALKVCCLAMGTKLNKPVPKEYFEKGILTEFEDRKYYVPAGYDKYLESVFGDYMKLPSEENRKSHHAFQAFYKKGSIICKQSF